MQRRKKNGFKKIGTISLLMDGEVIEVHRFNDGADIRNYIERYKRRIRLSRNRCEISVIFDLAETMKVYE